MNQSADFLKDEQDSDDLRVLADLNVESCVDEMFRPYLRLPEARERHLQVHTVAKNPAPEMTLPVENFLPVIVPKAAAITPPSTPREVREELLELRAEVFHLARTKGLQTLMICGVESGVGTSFVAGQLSRLLAEFIRLKIAFLTVIPNREKKISRFGRRTELQPQIHFLLRRTELPNLAEIASSNGNISLSEFLGSCETSEVIRQMKEEFDLIVIDAPAIDSFSETALLAALMDGVVLVAEPHVTPLRRLDRAYNRLDKAHANVLGMVFNRQHRL